MKPDFRFRPPKIFGQIFQKFLAKKFEKFGQKVLEGQIMCNSYKNNYEKILRNVGSLAF